MTPNVAILPEQNLVLEADECSHRKLNSEYPFYAKNEKMETKNPNQKQVFSLISLYFHKFSA